MRFLIPLLFLACGSALGAEPLQPLGAEPAGVTVSGVSSGGYMAVQMHVAHSAIVKGAGVIAAGPYYCAKGSLAKAYYNCLDPGFFVPLPATASLRAEAEAQAKAGRIDATAHLASGRAWIFYGTKDRTVSRDVVEALIAFYGAYKVDTRVVRDKPAGHAMITESAGTADCGATQSPFINDCDYDAAGEILKHLLGARAATKEGGALRSFDQNEFAAGDAAAISMAAAGFAYVPKACEAERCRIHVAFHGCRQSAGEIGQRFVREAGYNRWADAHRLIVLYPQASSSAWNPRACWDWWGYTGERYHTKEGAQVRVVKAMLERLSAARK